MPSGEIPSRSYNLIESKCNICNNEALITECSENYYNVFCCKCLTGFSIRVK